MEQVMICQYPKLTYTPLSLTSWNIHCQLVTLAFMATTHPMQTSMTEILQLLVVVLFKIAVQLAMTMKQQLLLSHQQPQQPFTDQMLIGQQRIVVVVTRMVLLVSHALGKHVTNVSIFGLEQSRTVTQINGCQTENSGSQIKSKISAQTDHGVTNRKLGKPYNL